MPEPCKQEVNIAELKADRNSFTTALERIEKGQTEFITVLREISAQGEQIKSLVQRIDKTEKDVTGLFARMRSVELAPGKQAGTVQMSVLMVVIAAVVAYISKKIGG